jgi:hypothetical protein
MTSSARAGRVVKGFLGSPFKLFASIFHWLIWHFDPSKYTKSQMPKVRRFMITAARNNQSCT